jgi:hypothetical protein
MNMNDKQTDEAKVVSLHDRSLKKSDSSDQDDNSFDLELKRNREITEKMKKERQKANQAVLRNYRLKT